MSACEAALVTLAWLFAAVMALRLAIVILEGWWNR